MEENEVKKHSHALPSARQKMMDYLARHDHSEKQLREKLEKSGYVELEIEEALQHGKDKGWIASSAEDLNALSEKTAETLARKGKGIEYINQYLEERGLPPVKADSEEQLEKARQLAQNKFSDMDNMDQNEKAKVARFLISRGFNMDIVRKVINE